MSAHTAARRQRRDSFGTVEKLPSGRYRAYYRVDGDKFSGPGTFPTKTAAQAWLAAERADRHRAIWHDPRLGQRTLREYADTWLAAHPKLAPRTRDLYRGYLDRWILPPLPTDRGRGTELGRLTLDQITPTVVRIWHAQVAATARAAAIARIQSRGRAHPARAWGRLNGFPETKRQGRMSPELLAAWNAAGGPRTPHSVGVEETHPNAGMTATAQAYALLHAILATAVVDRLIVENPCRIEGAAERRPRERGFAVPAEVDAIAAAFPAHLRAAVILAAWSGLRSGELFALARRHVNLKAGTVRVDRAIQFRTGHPPEFGNTKTSGSVRTVHLPGFVIDALRAHLAAHAAAFPDALVFTHNGKPVRASTISRLMRRACEPIGRQDLRWHDLRHTGATLAYSVGASMREVQRRLGHRTGRAAGIYQHAAQDSDQLIAERLNDLAAGAPVTPLRLAAHD